MIREEGRGEGEAGWKLLKYSGNRKEGMRGKSTKGMAANQPRTSASPGTIRKYMVQESSKDSPGTQTGAKNKAPESLPKMGTRRQLAEIDSHIVSGEILDEETAESQLKNQLPAKGKMAEMFAKLETSIKGEIDSLREDMN